MTWPAVTRKDHVAFCETEGWELLGDARGRVGTHHVRYRLALPDGRELRTRISHPPNRSTYGPSLWSHILRTQLQVTESEFWACVRDGVVPARGLPRPTGEPLPAEVVHLLLTRVGVSESEVAAMTKREAIARLQAFWDGGA